MTDGAEKMVFHGADHYTTFTLTGKKKLGRVVAYLSMVAVLNYLNSMLCCGYNPCHQYYPG